MLKLNNLKFKSIADRCKPYTKEHYLLHSSGKEIMFPPTVIPSVLDVSKNYRYGPLLSKADGNVKPQSITICVFTCRNFVRWDNVFPLLFSTSLDIRDILLITP
jgi:hypothetical protein